MSEGACARKLHVSEYYIVHDILHVSKDCMSTIITLCSKIASTRELHVPENCMSPKITCARELYAHENCIVFENCMCPRIAWAWELHVLENCTYPRICIVLENCMCQRIIWAQKLCWAGKCDFMLEKCNYTKFLSNQVTSNRICLNCIKTYTLSLLIIYFWRRHSLSALSFMAYKHHLIV